MNVNSYNNQLNPYNNQSYQVQSSVNASIRAQEDPSPSDSDQEQESLQTPNPQMQPQDPLCVSRDFYQQLNLGNRPSITFLEIAKDSIKMIEDNHLELTDTTDYKFLKDLVAKQSNDMNVLLFTLQTVAHQIEVARNQRREAEKKQEIIDNYATEIEMCKKAWEKAKTYGIDCTMLFAEDMKFIGNVACFFMSQRTIDDPEAVKKKLGEECLNYILEANALLTSITTDKKCPVALHDLETIFIADLILKTQHQPAKPIIKGQIPDAQRQNYSALKDKLSQLAGSMAYMREGWNTILNKSMVAAYQASTS